MPTDPTATMATLCHATGLRPRMLALMTVRAALALSLGIGVPVGVAQASELGALAVDALSSVAGDGASHVLIAIDNPSTAIATQNLSSGGAMLDAAADVTPDAGFETAAVNPASVSLGGVLQTGMASWYGTGWQGRRTASGTRFNPEAMTAASHTLPLGTRVLVTLEGTARSVLVTITDRQGAARRVIDLSKAAARKLGLLGRGTGRVILRRA